MMAMLITILLIAVFWNGLPSIKGEGNSLPISWKHFFQQDEEELERESHQETYAPTKSIPIDDIPNEPGWKIEETSPEQYQDQFQEQFDVIPLGPPIAGEAEDFTALKKKLEREYGATEILLEPWGSEGKMYRFSCYIFEPRGSSVKKLHQSIQATPTLAVQKVMEAVR